MTTEITLSLTSEELRLLTDAMESCRHTPELEALRAKLIHKSCRLRAIECEVGEISPATRDYVLALWREYGKIQAVKYVHYEVLNRRSLRLAKDVTDAIVGDA
jgi:hypothetical protein